MDARSIRYGNVEDRPSVSDSNSLKTFKADAVKISTSKTEMYDVDAAQHRSLPELMKLYDSMTNENNSSSYNAPTAETIATSQFIALPSPPAVSTGRTIDYGDYEGHGAKKTKYNPSAQDIGHAHPEERIAGIVPATLSRNCSMTDLNMKSKEKGKDKRWSKRYIWSEDLHQDFTSAVFCLGLERSSPSAVLLQMKSKAPDITLDKILPLLRQYQTHGKRLNKPNRSVSLPAIRTTQTSSKTDIDCVESQDEKRRFLSESDQVIPSVGTEESDSLYLPTLSDEEKKLLVAESIAYLHGLYLSLRQQLVEQRQNQSEAATSIAMQVQASCSTDQWEGRAFKTSDHDTTQPQIETNTKSSSTITSPQKFVAIRNGTDIFCHPYNDAKPCRFLSYSTGKGSDQTAATERVSTGCHNLYGNNNTAYSMPSQAIALYQPPLYQPLPVTGDTVQGGFHLQPIPGQTLATYPLESQQLSTNNSIPRSAMYLKCVAATANTLSHAYRNVPSDSTNSHPPVAQEYNTSSNILLDDNGSQILNNEIYECYYVDDPIFCDLMTEP